MRTASAASTEADDQRDRDIDPENARRVHEDVAIGKQRERDDRTDAHHPLASENPRRPTMVKMHHIAVKIA